MNLQTVTTTYAQRNFGKILDSLDESVVIMKDSRPVKVIVDYQEFLRMKKFEMDRLKKEFKDALSEMQSANKGIDEKKLDLLIREALHASGRD